jgi:hypothetical protein
VLRALHPLHVAPVGHYLRQARTGKQPAGVPGMRRLIGKTPLVRGGIHEASRQSTRVSSERLYAQSWSIALASIPFGRGFPPTCSPLE